MANLTKLKTDLTDLIKEGDILLENLKQNEFFIFQENYQLWYTEALSLVKKLLPSRLTNFVDYYEANRQIKYYLNSSKDATYHYSPVTDQEKLIGYHTE